MKKAAHVKTDAELSPQRQRRREHEQVYEVNACIKALPVPPGLGSEVSVSGPEGRDWQGSSQLCAGILQPTGCMVVELNVQVDHVHLLVKVPPKVSISKLMGVVKGRTALRLFTRYPYLRKKPYWGNHFWAKGYCVDTVGVDAT